MKKLFFSLLMLMAVSAGAKEKQDDTKYLAGAVPEVNGIVTFKKAFTVSEKSPQEVHATMKQFVEQLVANSIPAPGNYARVMEESPENIVARVCEWLVFKKKPLNLDRTRMRYQIAVETVGTRVGITVSALTYYYGEEPENQRSGVIFKAEEWISDKEALNKAKTKLYPKSGKFRRKTVDRMEEIFDAAMEAFAKKTHSGVTEE